MKPRFVVIAVILACSASTGTAGWKDDVGYTSLQTRLGTSIPTGADIDVTQVEGIQDGGYLPDFNDAQFAGKTITPMSGSSGVSNHATTVGRYYYGLTVSMARDIDIIDLYEVGDWTGTGFLRKYSSSVPKFETRRIQNHCWVGTFSGDDVLDIDTLRRLDYVIVRDGVFVAVGVNNGSINPMPKLLPNTSNAVAEGRSDAISSRGPTTLDEPGRLKPDIVAPFWAVSWAVPVVSSAGAVLLQSADADSNMD
ncbi:MAG: hypothetical protein JSV03_10335, partial [Planctomycetota bacterium]